MISLEINGKNHDVDVNPEVSLPWVMREHLRFTGTKFGFGIGLFGACTVHLDGNAQTARQRFSTLELRDRKNGRRNGGDI